MAPVSNFVAARAQKLQHKGQHGRLDD